MTLDLVWDEGLAVLSQNRLQSVLSKPHAPKQIQGLEHVYSLPGSALQTLNALDPFSCLSTPSNLSSHSVGLARLTSYPGTSLSELLFKRDVSPQVSFAGLIREPKYGHLAALHSALRACEAALLAVDEPLQLQLGPQQEVRGTGPYPLLCRYLNCSHVLELIRHTGRTAACLRTC